MLDILTQALATPGLIWLIIAISLAGLVRGFSGFGTALVFVPIAGVYLPPATIIGLMTMTGIISSLALVPRAWGQGDRTEVAKLALAAMVTVPIGLWMVSWMDPTVIRWIVAAVASITLAALLSGWRFEGKPGLIGLIGIGIAAGLIGGMTGLTGPVVILFYLAGRNAAQSVRANTILFLAALDFVVVGNLLITGGLTWAIIALAFVLSVPYFITSRVGQALFKPSYERIYRILAYVVIALAVLRGLPVWG